MEFILLSETVETALPVTLGTTRCPPRATMVDVEDIYKMPKLKIEKCQMLFLITEVRDLATGFGGTCEVEKES